MNEKEKEWKIKRSLIDLPDNSNSLKKLLKRLSIENNAIDLVENFYESNFFLICNEFDIKKMSGMTFGKNKSLKRTETTIYSL